MGDRPRPHAGEDRSGAEVCVTYASVFSRAAEADYERAIDWYLAEAPHQVERFEGYVVQAVAHITERPLLPPVTYRDLRHVRTEVFPYHLWYRVHDDIELVEVVAVLHDRQDQSRLSERV